MNIHGETPIGRIAAEHPMATRIFARHGIDFCCGGGQPLQDVCAQLNLDTEDVVSEIERELAPASDDLRCWDEAPLDELINHILGEFHGPLREELPRLEAMARKVLEVHGDYDREMLGDLSATLIALRAELEEHMQKEERILFPMIRNGNGRMVGGPVAMMEAEHDQAGQALRHLRRLTNDYTLPEGACTTWQALWHGLEALEISTHQHIHLENNILFPRALAS